MESMDDLFQKIDNLLSIEDEDKKVEIINEIHAYIMEKNPLNHNPVSFVKLVPIDKVKANNYNPNAVARTEMKLLHTSIDHDGYTQPVVTVYDEKTDTYIIIDGFHRYLTMKSYLDIHEKNNGFLPVVVLKKTLAERMAATVRHNRARGRHSVNGMSNMVFALLQENESDEQICNKLGMEPEELLRLKHITGFSALFENAEYNRSWVTEKQIELKKQYKQQHPDEEFFDYGKV